MKRITDKDEAKRWLDEEAERLGQSKDCLCLACQTARALLGRKLPKVASGPRSKVGPRA